MMKLHFKASLLLVTFLVSGCTNTPEYHLNDGILISNATIISASEDENIRSFEGHILIEADSIVYSGKELPKIKGSYKTINATGKFVIPGLIDSHVHVGHTITLKDEHYETRPELVKSYNEQLPKSYLYFGFTSLIDLDLNENTRNRFQKAAIKPDLYSTSRGVRYFDGYGPGLFPEHLRLKYFPRWIYDQSQLTSIPKDTDLSEHTIPAVVEQTIKDNAIGLKTYYEKGFGGVFDWPVPSDSLLVNLVNEAHQNNLPVVLHATSSDAYKKGLQANVDIFGHGLWHWEGSKLNPNPPDEIKSIYEEIRAKEKYVQSSMRVILGEYDTYTWSLINHPDIKHVLQNDFIKWLKSEEGRWSQEELIALYNSVIKDSTQSKEKYLKTFNERVIRTTKLAYDNGVRLILGSDSPAQEGIGNVPGLNGFLEIEALSEAGVDNKTIFLASTIRNARAFNLQHSLGSIKNGKRANMLILNQNPLLDVKAYNTIATVIVSGISYNREQLSATYNSQ
ncbi:amidohydrolase family protein [Muriicola sp. Z0-33]|uniref:amidohydrolase family protein n=1 Tax=Muriicola sp. Z0-33 TaxID=2816957 RepID=UPI0022378606|nr:amidohydrolase family protein [Muriicola sp. Z0-33]MCW5516010.1 amidohydrolase family protein [Muriicola sp. Z0-33]